MSYRHYQRLAWPVLITPGSFPVAIDQWLPSSNWLRADAPWRKQATSDYPFGALYVPSAPLTIDQWLPTPFRPRLWPILRSMPPHIEQPFIWGTGVIVVPTTPTGNPSVFLNMSQTTQIDLSAEHTTQIDLSAEHTTQIDLGMSYGG